MNISKEHYNLTNPKKKKDLDFIIKLAESYSKNNETDVYVFETNGKYGKCFDFSEKSVKDAIKVIRFVRRVTSKAILPDNGNGELETTKEKPKKSKPRRTRKNVE